MKRPLYQHFVFLEERIQHLRDQLTNPSLRPAEMDRLQSELELAIRALAHFRAGLDLEQQLPGSSPSLAVDPVPD